MALRSSHFDPNIDPALLASVEAAARSYKPYRVELRSGFRKGPRQHGQGRAVDVTLIDPKTGVPLDSYQAGGAVEPYQQFANYWYSQLDPAMQQQARWGGYFGDPADPSYGSKYGDQDYMHLDLGRSPHLGMLGGDWGTGFKPEAMAKLKLAAAGGLGEAAQAQAVETIAAAPPDVQRAFLSTIAGTESPGYDVMYGGGKFTDYSQHPNQRIPIMSGPNKGDYSSAAGRYQFLGSTWDELAKKYGYTDFKPGTQDKAAWQYANDVYKQKTGGSLEEALQSGDPGRINAAGQALSSVWTSLPGGIEQAHGYGTRTFADAFLKNLGVGGPKGPVEAAGGGAGADTPYSAPNAPVAPAVADAGTWWERMAKDIGKGGATIANAMGDQPARPRGMGAIPAARIDQGEVATIDPQQQELQRNQLAMALARLNSGRLTG